MLPSATLDYAVKPCLSIEINKITDFKGKPPLPRISHSATMFKDYKQHYYLVIYGGRNDRIYKHT